MSNPRGGNRQRGRELMAGPIGPWPPHGSATHKAARAHYARELIITGATLCAYPDCTSGPGRTRKVIRPGDQWDLAHDDDKPGVYLGPACLRCNRGIKRRHGRKGNRIIPRASKQTLTKNKTMNEKQSRAIQRLKILNQSEMKRRRRMILPTRRS